MNGPGPRREFLLEWGFSAACILAGLAGLRVVNDADLWKKFSLGSDAALKAGIFRRVDGGVRFKPRESLMWHDLAEKSQEVFGGDTVFTGADGRGEIQFTDGSTAQVLPDSLIVIRPPDETGPDALDWFSNLGRSMVGAGPVSAARIKVVQGGVKVRVRRNSKPPVVVADGRSFPLAAAPSAGGPAGEAADAEVEFKLDGANDAKVLRITSSSGALVDGTALAPGGERVFGEAAKAALNAPAAPVGAPVVEAAPAAPAVVALASPEPAASAVPLPSAEPVAVASPVAAPVATPVPKPKFVALPTLDVTAGGGSTQAVDYENLDKLSVRLQWKAIPGVEQYHIQVTDDQGRPAGEAKPKKASFELLLKSLKTVNYFYRIEAKLPTGEVIRSPRIPIRIELSAPIPRSPREGYAFGAREDRLITWAKTALTQGYHVQIAGDPTFARPELDQKSRNNFASFEDALPGRHYWRVRAYSDGRSSPWSPTRSFELPPAGFTTSKPGN